MVVLWHVPAVGDVNQMLLIKGSYLFVDFFFVLSGFIIFKNYHDRIRQGFGLVRFMFLRFGGLYPLRLFVLTLFVVGEVAKSYGGVRGSGVREPFSDPNSFEGLFLQLALLNAHGLYPTDTWSFPAWSIGAEFYTYLVFALVIRAAGAALPLALAVIGLGAMAVLLQSDHHNLDISQDQGFIRCIAGFAVGALCHLFRRKSNFIAISGRNNARAIEFALLAVVIGFVCFAAPNRASFAAPLVFAVVILVFACESGPVSRVLVTAPFRFVGRISYSIYMVHLFVLVYLSSMTGALERATGIRMTTAVSGDEGTIIALGVERWQGNIAHILALFPVLLVATVAYRLVEMPGRRASRRIAQRIGH